MSQAGAQGIEAPELAALFDDQDLHGVLAALDHAGEETRIVGGALGYEWLKKHGIGPAEPAKK